MIIFSLSELKSLENNLYKRLNLAPGLSRGKSEFTRFANGEWQARIYEKVQGQDCAIIGSFTPPDDQLIKTLILAHTLKKEGANKVIAIIPYLAYTRHDRNEQYKSFITDWIGKISSASGLDKIITIDIHSKAAGPLLRMPVINISPAELFLTQMNKTDLNEATIIAPDEGAKERADNFRQAAKISRQIAYFKKIRRQGKVTRTELVGKISANAILVDDVLDTGGTLISCAELLKKRGVKKITIAVTHGLFTDKKWKRLFKLNVTKMITTDSALSALRVKNKKIKIVSCAALLAKIIKPGI